MTKHSLLKNPWFSVSIVLFCFVVAQAYISYKFPIKRDLFGHRFSSHLGNRLAAHALLLKSGKKFKHSYQHPLNSPKETQSGLRGSWFARITEQPVVRDMTRHDRIEG